MMAILVIWLIIALVSIGVFVVIMTAIAFSTIERLADVAHVYRKLFKESALDWIHVTSAGKQANIDAERNRATLEAESDLLALARGRAFHEYRLAIRDGKQVQQ